MAISSLFLRPSTSSVIHTALMAPGKLLRAVGNDFCLTTVTLQASMTKSQRVSVLRERFHYNAVNGCDEMLE